MARRMPTPLELRDMRALEAALEELQAMAPIGELLPARAIGRDV